MTSFYANKKIMIFLIFCHYLEMFEFVEKYCRSKVHSNKVVNVQ